MGNIAAFVAPSVWPDWGDVLHQALMCGIFQCASTYFPLRSNSHICADAQCGSER